MHQAYNSFYYIFKEHLKLSQKINFLAHFVRFLLYAFLRPVSYTLIFCQTKRLIEVHNRGNFHWCIICGCQVINFQMFLWQSSIHEMASFGEVSKPFLCQIGLKFAEILTIDMSFIRQIQYLNNLSKLSV